MSKVVSIRLKEHQFERLRRAARQMGRTPSESAALILDEALREREFILVEFRDSPAGRQAYLKGSRLPIWQVAWIASKYHGDVAKTAEHLSITEHQVQAALSYASAYPAEIEESISDSQPSLEDLKRDMPWLDVVTIREDPS